MSKRILAVVLLAAFPLTAHAQQTAPAKLPFTLSKETTIITSPLRPDGTPDYVAALNEKYGKGVTAESNAFIPWLSITGTANNSIAPAFLNKTLTLLNAPPVAAGPYWISYNEYLQAQGIKDATQLDQAASEFTKLRLKFWLPADQIHPAAFLESQKNLLDRAFAAAAFSRRVLPAIPSDGRSMMSVLLPALRQVREVSESLCTRAMLKASTGDSDGAIADLIAAKRLARLVNSGASLIEVLVGIFVESNANESLGILVGSGQLTESQCNLLQQKLATLPAARPLAEIIDNAQRWSHLDVVQTLATGHSEGLAEIVPEQFLTTLDSAAVDWNAIVKDLNATYDKVVSLSAAPTLDGVQKLTAHRKAIMEKLVPQPEINPIRRRANETPEVYTQRIGQYIFAVMFPAFDVPVTRELHVQLSNRMLDLLLTAATKKAKTGTWPPELASFSTPDQRKDLYPAENPATLQYEITPKGARIFSAGPQKPIPLSLGIPK